MRVPGVLCEQLDGRLSRLTPDSLATYRNYRDAIRSNFFLNHPLLNFDLLMDFRHCLKPLLKLFDAIVGIPTIYFVHSYKFVFERDLAAFSGLRAHDCGRLSQIGYPISVTNLSRCSKLSVRIF